jgi:hypothetical protein
LRGCRAFTEPLIAGPSNARSTLNLRKNNEGFRDRPSRILSEDEAPTSPLTIESIDVALAETIERITPMFAQLAINLLSISLVMLAFGWAYDILQALASSHGRDAQTRPMIALGEQKRTVLHG